MSLKFVKIPSPTTELAALEHLKKSMNNAAFIFDWILFILAGTIDNQKVSHGFKFLPDQMLESRVSCP